MGGASPNRAAAGYAVRAVAWGLGLFGLLRLPLVERGLLLPLIALQQTVASWHGGASSVPVVVGLSCSAADVIALCLGAILAYPAPWRARLAGAGAGLGLILALNTARIGTLSRAASDRRLFDALHLYIWPAGLILATVGYVFTWMLLVERRRGSSGAPSRGVAALPRRFALCSAALLGLYLVFVPWYLESAPASMVAHWVAETAAAAFGVLGLPVSLYGAVLMTGRGGYVVTPECVTTPLMPLYLAAALTLPLSRAHRLLALLAFAPLFAGLGVLRLLVLAIPSSLVGSPLFLVHGFYQLVLACLAVGALSFWREGFARAGARRAGGRALLACAAGLTLAVLGGRAYTVAVLAVAQALSPLAPSLAQLAGPAESQGALLVLPAYQAGLFLALWLAAFAGRRWGGLAAGLGALLVSQVVLLVAVGALEARAHLAAPVLLVRALAVAAPALLLLVMLRQRPWVIAPAAAPRSA